MIYNYVLTVGDSMTTGARTHYNYGFYLAKYLRDYGVGGCRWYCVCRATNKYRVEDVRVNIYDWLKPCNDIHLLCLLVGTNDCKIGTTENPDFREGYTQILDVCLAHDKKVIAATIPPIVPYATPECFPRNVEEVVNEKNNIIFDLINSYYPMVTLCRLDKIIDPKVHLEDGVHLNVRGNMLVAKSFSNAIRGVSDD